MKYIDVPRPRYLTVPLLLMPGLMLAMVVTGLSLGMIRGMRMWMDAMDWATYER